MADIWPPAKRSEVMSRIRARNTGPERALKAALRRVGMSYRTYPRLPGRPDVVLPSVRVAVFVHGDFWHGCPRHFKAPVTRRAFWAAKLKQNRSRDARVIRELRGAGWRVLVVWECRIEEDLAGVVRRIERWGHRPRSPNGRGRARDRTREKRGDGIPRLAERRTETSEEDVVVAKGPQPGSLAIGGSSREVGVDETVRIPT
jgi:DNA mismatch endonuclease (patch repair protein)